MITKKILAAAIASQPVTEGVVNAIDFDGANDYLSRSSDLVGNADGKTFTFSAWVWPNNTADFGIYNAVLNEGAAQLGFAVSGGSNQLQIQARNPSGSLVLSVAGGAQWSYQTWNHVLISVDLTDTAKRSIYINDVFQSVSWTTYINDLIDFTRPEHKIGVKPASDKYPERLSNIFFDHTYRDLSVEANRRLFITAGRKTTDKSTLQALSPILYLPLDDPTQAGKNLGTGGDFTLNGVVARSGRGPNQFNAAYSDFDGAADYLRRNSIIGISDGKQLTISFNCRLDSISGTAVILQFSISGLPVFRVFFNNGVLSIEGFNSSYVNILSATFGAAFIIGRNYHVALSIDLSSTSLRYCYINGNYFSGSWATYTNDLIDFDVGGASPAYSVGASPIPSNYINGYLGNLFFDTKYIDLSIPSNLAKFVAGMGSDAKPVDLGVNGEKLFGTPPLIYLPIYGGNAGKNYGSGGDFTVNSGPFTGARGANEYWGNWATFNGTTGYLNRSSQMVGVLNSNRLSLSCLLNKRTTSTGQYILGTNNRAVLAFINGSDQLVLIGKNSIGTTILTATVTSPTISNTTVFSLMFFCDLSDTLKRGIYINGNAASSITWSTYTNDAIALSQATTMQIGANGDGVGKLDGNLSELYFATDYIDFSQEANRLKFRDAFGNPVDLRPQIQAGTLPNPAIYMRFDPSNFGKNDGTGGDFVVNGTITDGGQL